MGELSCTGFSLEVFVLLLLRNDESVLAKFFYVLKRIMLGFDIKNV